MESKKDLVKIGMEGFAILDGYHSHRAGKFSAPPKPPTQKTSYNMQTCLYQYQPQKPDVYQLNPFTGTEKVVIQKHDQPKPDLAKIAKEGFDLLDQYYGKKPKPVPFKPVVPMQGPKKQAQAQAHAQACYYQYQPEKSNVYQMKPEYAAEEKVMNAYEAAKMHGGLLIVERFN